FGRIDLSSLIPGSVPEAYLKDDIAYQDMKDSLTCLLSEFSQHPDEEGRRELVDEAIKKVETYHKATALLHPAEPMVNTSGKLPEADICFLDEIFKCNDGVLNSLLTALNERKYTNEGRTYDIPTISFFAASNEIPNFNDPQEKILAALYDRLELKVVTANIADRDKRLAVLRDKQTGRFGTVSATITLNELRDMQKEVAAIPVPDAINELVDDILCELRKEVPVSDRKYLNYYPIAQAKAWLNGHAEVESTDLLALKNYLWYKPADMPMVEMTLTRMCVNPMQDKVNDVRAAAKEVIDELNASTEAGADARKAFRKFRSEILRVYQLYTDLAGKAQGNSEKAMLDGLLSDLENSSRTAHEKYGFTYMPLQELAELQ
ncbi:MAG: AAA family ATPase, partial [Oscillospiraceae bacterium]|nr:AAA family ATPase [Oscillospiraceae bacterium]